MREFEEELGAAPPAGAARLDLGTVTLKSRKRVTAWAIEAPGLDASAIVSNSFEMEWPPRSGRMQAFPEVDRAEWFDPPTARLKLNPAQAAFVDRLLEQLEGRR